jgi:hypothetical protein
VEVNEMAEKLRWVAILLVMVVLVMQLGWWAPVAAVPFGALMVGDQVLGIWVEHLKEDLRRRGIEP